MTELIRKSVSRTGVIVLICFGSLLLVFTILIGYSPLQWGGIIVMLAGGVVLLLALGNRPRIELSELGFRMWAIVVILVFTGYGLFFLGSSYYYMSMTWLVLWHFLLAITLYQTYVIFGPKQRTWRKSYPCPSCGYPIELYAHYGRYFCHRCQRYV